MRLNIYKILLSLVCVLIALSVFLVKAYAETTVSGKVIMQGTGSGIRNIWVKWIEDYGTPYQSAYRYAKTDNSGNFSFTDLTTLNNGELKKLLDNSIDTNSDGTNDDVEVFVDASKPIPNAASGAEAPYHFNGANSPHNFTGVVPQGFTGTFTDQTISINDSESNSDITIEYIPSSESGETTNTYTISGNLTNKDASGSAYANATVNLTGDKTASAVTDSNGAFSFSELNSGSYKISLVVPAGFVTTGSYEQDISLSGNTTVNFEITADTGGTGCTSSVGGSVYNDLNANGVFDTGETPLQNWTINLTSSTSATTTTTNSLGAYSFTGLCSEVFTVTQVVNSPWYSTTGKLSEVLHVISPNTYTSNFFNAEKFTISGEAVYDTNGDGVLSENKGVKNLAVILQGDTVKGIINRQTNTNSKGEYTFKNLPPGSYQLLFGELSGYRSTTPNAWSVNALNADQKIDYGVTPLNLKKILGACGNTTLDIVLVIDHSGSMSDDDDATGIEKMKEARDAAKNFVDVIYKNLPTARIGLVEFSDSDNFPNGDSTKILSSLTYDAAALKTQIDAIETDQATCVQCGVRMANQVLSEAEQRSNAQKMIIFLTDGMANMTADDPGSGIDTYDAENAAMSDIMSGINSQNIIYETIGLGSESMGGDNIDANFLKAIAKTNGGSYYNDPTYGDLDKIFNAIASSIVPIGNITGSIYEDKNLNGKLDTGEPPISGMPLDLAGKNLISNMSVSSDTNGFYGFYGLCDSDYSGKLNPYTVTELKNIPWILTTPEAIGISLLDQASYPNNNFGNRYGYQISGSVFNDINKNRLKDGTDANYTGPITITSKGSLTDGIVNINPDGTFSITGLYPGSYYITLSSPIPKGYKLIWPGPPPTFYVTVGPNLTCAVDTTTGAACTKDGDVTGLNFSISNSIPWMQSYGLDMRFDNGLTNMIPSGTTCGGGPYAEGIIDSVVNPGILFTGNSTWEFGEGDVSTTKQIVGGSSYPEMYSTNSTLKTSTKTLNSLAQDAGLDIQSLPCTEPQKSCDLSKIKDPGFYYTSGNLTVDKSVNFQNGAYVIVAGGDLNIKDGITIRAGINATVIFSADNILIDSSIQSSKYSCPDGDGELQGIFSANKDIVIDGNNGNCIAGADGILHIDGMLIANAEKGAGYFQNKRDLCANNPNYPSVTIRARPSFILNMPGFLTQQSMVSQEEN